MKSMATATLAATLLGLTLGGCVTTGGTVDLSTPQAKSAAIDAVYTPIRIMASLCGSGLLCKDPNVAINVRIAIPVADEAVAEAKAQIMLSGGDEASIAKWSGYAISAVNVLAKALEAYGVKASQ